MAIFYGEREPGHPISYEKLMKANANAKYMEHYGNLLTLTFIANETRDMRERTEALAETKICERKLAWWRLHPNFDQQVVANSCLVLKSQWASNRARAA